jgi:hypothetical protein
MNPDEMFERHPMTVICAECSEYMEFADEGVNDEGQICDLYVCLECGYQTAIAQTAFGRQPPRFSWDPPDGAYEP